VLGSLGMSRTGAEQMIASASGAVYSLRAKLDIDADIPWDHHLGQFEVGREPIELLTRERSDSPMFEAGHKGGLMVAGGAAALLGGLAAAPAVATELGLLAAAGSRAAAAGSSAASSAHLWALHHPQLAQGLAGLATSQAISAADAGSVSAWADNLTSPQGLLELAMGSLFAYDASLAARPVARRPAPGPAARQPAAPSRAVAFARSQQGSFPYSGVDKYREITLRAGTVVYGGVPGQSAFYLTERALRLSGGTQSGLYDGLQIEVNKKFGKRPGVTAYRVTKDTQVAIGVAAANPQLGAGGLTQVVIEDYGRVLEPLHSVPLERR
jgi:hypothetical protein